MKTPKHESASAAVWPDKKSRLNNMLSDGASQFNPTRNLKKKFQ